MNRPLTFFAVVLLLTSACARAQQQSRTSTPTEQIHSVLCAIDQNSYEAAQKTLEQLLASDPKNANYQKALLGVQARQVKRDDHSAQNVALIKKTIEAYNQAFKNLQLTSDEKQRVDKSLIFLYGQLGEEELKNELLRRAADPQRTAKDRTEAYVVLAGKLWDCSFRITSAKSSPDKAATEKAQTCTNEGLRYANEALALTPDDESAWSYKTNLLHEAAVLAGLRHDQAQKAAYQSQYKESLKQAQEASSKAQAQREKESAQSEEARKKDSFTTEEAEQAIKDLTELHLENSFDKVASDLLSMPLELTSLVAPVDGAKEEKQSVKSPTPGSTAQQKYDWKTFAANDDLMMDLPDNVRQTTGGGYEAASEGVIYSVIPVPRSAVQTERQVVNGILNTLARTQAHFFSGAWLSGALANRYELKFIRSEATGGEPRKTYAYSLISCRERKDGVMIVQASQTHYYTIDINGAGESDPRAQRVLTSIKVK
jgi:hypothetical protein